MLWSEGVIVALWHLQLYHGENKLHFDEEIMMSTLYYINIFSWICFNCASSLKKHMHLHSDTLS